jgi:hypothetical protein
MVRKKKKTGIRRGVDVKLTPSGLRVEDLPEGEAGVFVTTSRGVEVECLPIADVIEAQEANIRASVEWPEQPTRIIADVAGSEMEEPLTEAYIETAHASHEEIEAWVSYKGKQAQAEAEFSARLNDGRVKLLAQRGVRWNDDLEAEWTKDDEWAGMTVPEDPRERKLHFFRTQVLGNLGDLYRVLFGIYQASGYDEEVLDLMEASFRSEMGRAGGDEPEDGAGGHGPQPEESLVGRPEVDGD